MHPSIHIIGTLDTKGAEIAYLRDRLQALRLATTVISEARASRYLVAFMGVLVLAFLLLSRRIS